MKDWEKWVSYVREVHDEYWDDFRVWETTGVGEPPIGVHFLIKDVCHSKEWMASVVHGHGFTCSFLV